MSGTIPNATSALPLKLNKKGVNPFTIFIESVALVCFALNSTTLLLINRISRHTTLKSEHFLIANLSLMCIIAIGIEVLFLWESEIVFNGQMMCSLFSYLRSFIINVIPINVLAISYERMRKFTPTMCKIPSIVWVPFIWVLAAIGAAPTCFTIEYDCDKAVCYKIPLLWWTGFFYEILRCIVFHVLVAAFLAYELYKVQRMFANIRNRPIEATEIVRESMQSVRFIYFNSAAFFLAWLPFVIVLCIYKMVRGTLAKKLEYHNVNSFMSGWFLVYLICLPLIIFWTSGDLTTRSRGSRRGKSGEVAGGEVGAIQK